MLCNVTHSYHVYGHLCRTMVASASPIAAATSIGKILAVHVMGWMLESTPPMAPRRATGEKQQQQLGGSCPTPSLIR